MARVPGPWLLKPRSQASGIGMKKFTRRTISGRGSTVLGTINRPIYWNNSSRAAFFTWTASSASARFYSPKAHAYGAPPLDVFTRWRRLHDAHTSSRSRGNRATSQPQPKPDAGPRSRSRRYSRRIPESHATEKYISWKSPRALAALTLLTSSRLRPASIFGANGPSSTSVPGRLLTNCRMWRKTTRE